MELLRTTAKLSSQYVKKLLLLERLLTRSEIFYSLDFNNEFVTGNATIVVQGFLPKLGSTEPLYIHR